MVLVTNRPLLTVLLPSVPRFLKRLPSSTRKNFRNVWLNSLAVLPLSSWCRYGNGTEDKKLRIEDALNATRAAVAEGIVAGGGTALLQVQPALDELEKETEGDEKTGIDIVRRAIEAPVRQIANNAGLEGAVIVEAVKKLRRELASMPRRKNMLI